MYTILCASLIDGMLIPECEVTEYKDMVESYVQHYWDEFMEFHYKVEDIDYTKRPVYDENSSAMMEYSCGDDRMTIRVITWR